MKNAFLLTAFITLSLTSLAQMDANYSYNPDKALQFYVGIGAAHNDYKNLNTTLDYADLPAVGRYTFASALEADIRHKSLLAGLTFHMGLSYRKQTPYNVLLLNLAPQANLGYYIYNNKKFHLAPQVGIGLFSSEINLVQSDDIDDFNVLLADKNAISINQNVTALDFCLRLDFADFSKPKAGAASIKLGYKYGLSERGWGIDVTSNSTIDNSPEDRISQFYILLCVGVSLLKPEHHK